MLAQGHAEPLFRTKYYILTILFALHRFNCKSNQPVGCFAPTIFSLCTYGPLFPCGQYGKSWTAEESNTMWRALHIQGIGVSHTNRESTLAMFILAYWWCSGILGWSKIEQLLSTLWILDWILVGILLWICLNWKVFPHHLNLCDCINRRKMIWSFQTIHLNNIICSI